MAQFPAVIDLSTLDGTNGFRLDGIVPNDLSGVSVASAGDVNGEGFADLLIGAPYADPGGSLAAGESYVVFGKASGFSAALDLSSLDGSNGFRLEGISPSDNAGRAVAAGDVNSDGFGDILIGARGGDPGGDSNAGESYVVFGRKPDTAVTLIGTVASQTLAGGDFNDTLSGLGGNDSLWGHGGGDALLGGFGADIIRGGSGNDVIEGGGGQDVLDGGTGRDTLSYAGPPGGVTVNLLTNTVSGGHATGDSILNFENLLGSGFNDNPTGNAGANRLTGGGGKDVLRGNLGRDVFDFNALTDSGPAFAARDFIGDMTVDPAAGAAFVDRIDLATIDAMAGTGGNQAFTFIGSAAFTAEGQIRAVQFGANTSVQINTAGAGAAEMTIILANLMASDLSAVDFVL
jgi:Ca2+-binding RTX toxin-like protein